MKMDPPGGNTVDLHRRVWVGQGGIGADGYVRVTANRIGLGGDLELAFPKTLACFKARGASEVFFHGGLSLQELVIPVAIIKVRQSVTAAPTAGSVRLMMERPRITTRFFSVTAVYNPGGLFSSEEKRVRLSVRSSKREIGTAVMAAYGFEAGTQEVVLQREKPNAVTLMLSLDTPVESASVHVLDAISQIELARLENITVTVLL